MKPYLPDKSDSTRTPAEILAKAAVLARKPEPFGLRIPFDRRVAVALAVAGCRVVSDLDRNIAHVKCDVDRGAL